MREPETNGVVEGFHRIFKEQIVHGRQYHSVEDLRRAVAVFIGQYNEHWLLEKLDYHSPKKARRLYLEGANFAKQRKIILSALAEHREEHSYFILAESI